MSMDDTKDDTKILGYITLRHSTHLNYHHAEIRPEDYKTLIPQAIKSVEEVPTVVLRAIKDPKYLLELGIRQWTGYGASVDKPGAAAGWTFIATHQQDVPDPLKARAYSLLAKAWLDLAQEDAPGALNISYLADAGNSANGAAALGLISPAVLAVASKIETAGFRRPEDNKFPEHSTEKFERLTDLWEAWDARKEELAEQRSKREAKVSRDPLSYFCAAEDCGIIATKKSTLRRCGGGCPREFKPSYCSKYCQTADRKHHRPYCDPGATESSVRPVDNRSAAAVEPRPDVPEEDTDKEKFEPGPERAINVNIGEETVQIASRTIPSQMLREMKGVVESRQ